MRTPSGNLPPKLLEEISEVSFGKGVLKSARWRLNDIVITHSTVFHDKPFSHHASGEDEAVRLHFGLRGDYSFSYPQIGRQFTLKAGHHNIMYSRGIDLHMDLCGPVTETFGINFPRETFVSFTEGANDALKRFAEHLLKGENVILSDHWQIVDLPIQRIIREIINCRFTGRLKELFLLSKSIELLVYQAEMFDRGNAPEKPVIRTRGDKEKILAARDLVVENVASPPSLSEIARITGLNEFKLKKGFKETFNSTVFGYLSEHRLELARERLMNTTETASEIAFQLGYASPQHFNNAFRKKFGASPGSFRK